MYSGESFPNTNPAPTQPDTPRIANSTHTDIENFSRSVFRAWLKEILDCVSVDEGMCLCRCKPEICAGRFLFEKKDRFVDDSLWTAILPSSQNQDNRGNRGDWQRAD